MALKENMPIKNELTYRLLPIGVRKMGAKGHEADEIRHNMLGWDIQTMAGDFVTTVLFFSLSETEV